MRQTAVLSESRLLCLRILTSQTCMCRERPPSTTCCRSMDLLKWDCLIPGKDGTAWHNGFYPLTLEFTEEYPSRPPKVHCHLQHADLAAHFVDIQACPGVGSPHWQCCSASHEPCLCSANSQPDFSIPMSTRPVPCVFP